MEGWWRWINVPPELVESRRHPEKDPKTSLKRRDSENTVCREEKTSTDIRSKVSTTQYTRRRVGEQRLYLLHIVVLNQSLWSRK
jgi:hypothetical protein